VTGVDWSRLLKRLDVDDPAVGQVAEALAAATDTSVSAAYDRVEAALEAGDLVEREREDGFDVVDVPGARGESGPDDAEDGELPHDSEQDSAKWGNSAGDGAALRAVSEATAYPPALQAREWWVAWILDGVERKRPVAPWQTGHAYPVEWRHDLDADERPEVDFDTASRWTDFELADLGLSLPEDAKSERLRLGVILPLERPAREERVVLIDWDDVRDPETGAVHPTAGTFIEEYGGYVEISRSGKGLHQFVFGGLRHREKFIAPIDDEPFVDDDRPQVEIYDGGRHVALTGQHVAGTDRDLVDGPECIDAIVSEHAAAELDAGYRTYDPESGTEADDRDDSEQDSSPSVPEPESTDYEGPPLDELRASKPPDRSLDYHAVVEAFCAAHAGVLNWRLEGAAAALGERDGRAVDEVLQDLRGEQREGGSQGYDRKTAGRVRYDYERAEREEFAPPSWETLARWGAVPESDSSDTEDDTTADDLPRVVDEDVAPPADDLKPADVDAIRERIHGPIYESFTEHGGAPTVLAHDPGAGKTTTVDLAAADRDRPVAFLFDKHRKAHEHRAADLTPEADLHLRGAAQPREDACARAVYEGGACDEHGDPSNCPRMCPLYDLDHGHPDRQVFEAVAAEVGPVTAHVILDPHDGEACAWMDTFDDLQDAARVVGVHEYQRLKTVRATDDGPRDVLVDESPGDLAADHRLTVDKLVSLANTLEGWASNGPTAETLRRFGRFARDLYNAVDEGEDIASLAPPEPARDGRQRYNSAAGHYMEHEPLEETLARARRAFLDRLLWDIRDDEREWDGTPLAFDALLAAAAEAGLDETAARTVAGQPLDLEYCPVCVTELDYAEGRRVCDECGWDEDGGRYTAGEHPPARILAWIDADPHDPEAEPALVRRRLPATEDLPDDPLVLDATATPEKIAAFYGVDEADVQVHGAEQHALEHCHVTQILDGQYHYSTLKNAVEEGHASADRIQTHLDRVGELHDRPLVVGRQGVRELFDLPENARFIHFHGARGLNFSECDAVVVVGAPHPDMGDIRRTARLLAQDRDDLRGGGVEHSTRNDAPNPPVYRKLRYTDDEGRGRAVATKHYTGLVGALFREAREKEIEQIVHRIRPLLASSDAPAHAYLLTNVPTDPPVDEVCSLEELTESPAAAFPVVEGALTLAGTLADVAAGDAPDGFRVDSLVKRDGNGGVRFRIREVHRLARATGQDVAERTVRRWVDDLEAVGLVDSGDYVAREGVPYSADGATLTRALSVLTSNAGVEVAIKRRLAALASEADSAAAWLRAARDLATVGVDPETGLAAFDGGDRPPDDPV